MAFLPKQTKVRNKIIRTIHKLMLAGMLFLLLSCVDSAVYRSTQTLSSQVLSNRDTLTFLIDNLSDSLNLKMEVEVRTVHTFPYQKLSLTVEQCWSKKPVQKDIVILKTTPEEGTIYLSPSISSPIYIKEASKKGVIKIYSNMRRESLSGINDVGITLTHQ